MIICLLYAERTWYVYYTSNWVWDDILSEINLFRCNVDMLISTLDVNESFLFSQQEAILTA